VSEEGQKHAGGRPTLYDEAHCERVVSLGAEGMGRAEIAFELGVCRNTLANWEQAHPEFLRAMTRANDASLAWWERSGRTGLLMGSGFNAGLYGKCMSGRFPAEPYRERIEHAGPGGSELKPTVIQLVAPSLNDRRDD
jgi:hypothetical protein